MSTFPNNGNQFFGQPTGFNQNGQVFSPNNGNQFFGQQTGFNSNGQVFSRNSGNGFSSGGFNFYG